MFCTSCGNPIPGGMTSCPTCGKSASALTATDPASEGPGPSAEPAATGSYLAPGTVIDNKYVLSRVLGEGGMGVVYLAHDKNTGVDVVLKAMRSELAHRPDVRERTLYEGKALARIDHPNVVRLNAVIDEPPMLWLAMQYIEGESLEARIERYKSAGQSMPVDEALSIFKQIGQGVAAAHREGLIHRDLKPGNVLLRAKDGIAKVGDFGIAKAEGDAREGKGVTKQGIVGSLWYMSPEQVRGRRDLDKRVDIYALGVVLYEMLTGRVPFDADSQFEVMRLHAEQPLPSVCAQRPEVPPYIDSVIQRATAKDRDQRFSSCDELLAALDALGASTSSYAGSAPTAAALYPGQGPVIGATQQQLPALEFAAGAYSSGAARPATPTFGPTTTGGQALPGPYPPAAGYPPPPARPPAPASKLPLILLGAAAIAGVAVFAAYKLNSSSGDSGDDAPKAARSAAESKKAARRQDGSPGSAKPKKADKPANPLAALVGRWAVKDSDKRLRAVLSGDAVEFRVIEPAQFDGADYRAGDARFVLRPIGGSANTFSVEDHLRPRPPVGFHFDGGSRSTCQLELTAAQGEPLGARFDGSRLDIDLGAISPGARNFTVSGSAVLSCSLQQLVPVRVSATLARDGS